MNCALTLCARGRAAYDSDRQTIPPGFTRGWTKRCDCGGRAGGFDGSNSEGGRFAEDKALEERERERGRRKGDGRAREEYARAYNVERNGDVLLTQTVCSFLFHKSLIYNYDMHSFV